MNTFDELSPIRFDESGIHFDSRMFFKWKEQNFSEEQCIVNGIIPLTEKTPVIALFEDDEKTVEYCLETEEGEDLWQVFFFPWIRFL